MNKIFLLKYLLQNNMAQNIDEKYLQSIDPQNRLKQLINYCNTVDVDPHVPPIKYYRSGLEMVRQANVYYEEGSLENAYVLYLKFMTIFLEKIRKHPGFNTVPVDMKARNKVKLREVLPKAEKIKKELLNQYQENLNIFLAEKKREEEKKNAKKPVRTKPEPVLTPAKYTPTIDVRTPEMLETITFPDVDVRSNTPQIPLAPPPSDTNLASADGKICPPAVDRGSKPSLPFRDNTMLRRLIVPIKVMTLFQAMAQTNTSKNIETCGVLTGKLEKNELIITHMILPKQKGTSDSCVTMNEEEIFDYQDQHNLITLGWIHTHPTQTAFLSSVDLHTHCPYQLLMPEAVAIVCSPKYMETGFFNLTPHYGLQYIANCRKTGFHPHPTDPPLFMVAEHVRVENEAPLEVLDLRKG